MYLLREKRFIDSGEEIYLVGSIQVGDMDAIKRVPKGGKTPIILLYEKSAGKNEAGLLTLFSRLFTKRIEYGDKYFSGDSQEMQLQMTRYLA